ncbi:toxin-antitoxin system YwqK family antitoxin [Microscilla marina]|uniref:Toxin-antitoxin system YwqK family antitoxin n=1 Tax=Microscilla marina ATCC 23134 TaxID=313606 RepID=A1ZX72_MICM2|nr:hypothetical protein [Microscilla marina]EAY25053.1 conserved hypothetical protein [Microscilla marina ATCC 23134]
MKKSAPLLLCCCILVVNTTFSAQAQKLEKFYYKNGQLRRTAKMIGGKVAGPITDYFESGKVKVKYTIDQNAKKNGPWISYFENGRVKEMVEFKNNQRHGTQVVFYFSGVIRWVGYYDNGIKVGTWMYYSKTGKQEGTHKY